MSQAAPKQLRTNLDVTNDVLAAIGSASAEEPEQRTVLEIAEDLLVCMEADLQHIAELRSLLVAIWRDPEATAHIKNVAGAGIDTSHFVSKGLEVLALVFKEELAALEPAGEAAEVGGAV